MMGVLAGAIVGGAIVWFFGDHLRQLARHGAREAQDAVVRGLHGVQATTEGAIDTAKEHARRGFQAGQDYMRPDDSQAKETYR